MTIHRITRSSAADRRQEVADLFVAYRAFYGRSGDEDAARRFLDERLREGDTLLWGVIDDESVRAFAQVFPQHSSLDLATSWTLNDLFVRGSDRGRGRGRALLEHVVREAHAAGIRSIRLETERTNTTAIALYESEGFSAVIDDDEHAFVTYELDVAGRVA